MRFVTHPSSVYVQISRCLTLVMTSWGLPFFEVGDGADILLFCVDDGFLAIEVQTLDVRVSTVEVDAQDTGFFLTHACNGLVAVEGRSIDQANRDSFGTSRVAASMSMAASSSIC